ncbi:sensor histidine kinase [Streptomyces iconiensis]|uniref:histidine kinase n=1 Tax=Streptomyces iconiensis TaxID=1384038 RepID=A0ABT7A8D2_9ACTN|nr:sensor domain-containing protein [Streptomyces iconiensis]MDJ1137096.1 sensor domain-containing protein [Streptomyces iconiensis]
MPRLPSPPHALPAAPYGLRDLAGLLWALLSVPLGLVLLAVELAGLVLGGLLSWTAPGLWLLALTVRGALAAGDLHRAVTRKVWGETVDPPPRSTGAGALAWRRALLRERAGWRAVGWSLLAWFIALPPLAAVTIGYVYGLLLLTHPLIQRWNYTTVHLPDGSTRRVSLEVGGVQFDTWPRWLLPMLVGAVLLLLAPTLVRLATAPQRVLQAALLGCSPADQRIRTLEETRAQAVTDADATLRRIERDLHDGTQARLVGLGMHLTLVRELVAAGAEKEELLAVLETARGNATAAVADLRDLVKGIHPPVLDQGLETALATLVAGCPLDTELSCDIHRRPDPALESIAYFCAAELLANATKHSGSSSLTVDAYTETRALVLSVRDEGHGGAVVGAGSGLTGLLARVRTVDGTLECDSPPGGPTVVTVRLPMA